MNPQLRVGVGSALNAVALSTLLKPERLTWRRYAPREP
jgi:hypothetical protein